ncbi:hypothetical protein A2U01_0011559 [Trifolium medium]|uniref:Uncharacterized protein n=1 Tax=Trifolium medium TaxID=97028 RepID=A0A392MVC2_9FABA|nr:hypothetical protein [Trifolium medium]
MVRDSRIRENPLTLNINHPTPLPHQYVLESVTAAAKHLETNPTIANTAPKKHLSIRPPLERRSCRTNEIQAPNHDNQNHTNTNTANLVGTTTQHHLRQHPTTSTTPPLPKTEHTTTTDSHHAPPPPPPRLPGETTLATTTITENREHLNRAKPKRQNTKTPTIAVPASSITPKRNTSSGGGPATVGEGGAGDQIGIWQGDTEQRSSSHHPLISLHCDGQNLDFRVGCRRRPI